MKIQRIELTGRELDRLVGDLRSIPPSPPEQCLTDEQFVAYTLGKLGDEQTEQLDAHIAACPTCAQSLEHALQQLESQQKRVVAEKERALGLTSIFSAIFRDAVASWNEFRLQPLPLAAAGEGDRLLWEWKSPVGDHQAHMVLDPNGDLTFRFVTTDARMVGCRVRLRVSNRWLASRVEAVSQTEFGAKIVVQKPESPQDLSHFSLDFAA